MSIQPDRERVAAATGSSAVRDIYMLLDHQVNTAWRLLKLHLTDLTDEECLWRPAGRGPHVFAHAGVWKADWPETEAYDAGPASIAWLTWHIGFSDRPFHHLAGWLNLELMKNAAEIGYCRFLYASRHDRPGSPVPPAAGS